MSLEWLLKSVDCSIYESLEEVNDQDKQVILSEQYDLQELLRCINTSDYQISCLVLEIIDIDEESKDKIQRLLIKTIPVPNSLNELDQLRRSLISRLRLLLRVINVGLLSDTEITQLNTSIINYIDPNLPWSNETLLTLSQQIPIDQDIIIQSLHHKLIKLTQLNKSKPKFKSFNLNPNLGLFKSSSLELDTWKQDNLGIISCLNYLIQNKCARFDVIIPLLLTFLDDHNIDIKILCCHSLYQLIQIPQVLSIYKSVFIDSLQSCLLYLPNLTPISKSLSLLKVSYRCLLQIYDDSDLVKLVNESIMNSMISIRDKSFEILKFFVELLIDIIDRVKVKMILTLPKLIPLLLNVLVDPYLQSHHGVLVRDVELLKSIIKYCWPVVDKYEYDLLGATIICMRLNEQTGIRSDGTSEQSDIRADTKSDLHIQLQQLLTIIYQLDKNLPKISI